MCVRDSILGGMELVGSGFLKTNGLSSILRNASFSKGWLHLVIQGFFAIIIVSSFILIIIMSVPRFSQTKPVPPRPPRCHSNNCVIYCDEVPYFGKYREDIVYSVLNLPESCNGYNLVLRNPMFTNETLPPHWLPRIRLPMHELSIVEGNLMHFPPQAFLCKEAAAIRTLVLMGLMIKTFTENSLVGLANLKQVYIKKCNIVNIDKYALQPVDDTIETLTITESHQWDPTNITGATNLAKLTTVDFSNNALNDILNTNSFTGLKNCKTLYLNSCKISTIGVGAFDYLHSIEMLFLNNNLLVTIPNSLFANILTLRNPKPRINMQDNLWYCNCLVEDIKQLVLKDMLLVDPTCVLPENFKGKTFTEIESYCNNDTNDSIISTSNKIMTTMMSDNDVTGFVYMDNGCQFGNETSTNTSVAILSPLQGHNCWFAGLYKENISITRSTQYNQIVSLSSWIKFTFLIKSDLYSMIQIGAKSATNYGLLWYQSTCPNEVYCVNIVPTALRVYNVDLDASYVFCPVQLNTGAIENENCISYNLATIEKFSLENKVNILLYVSTGGICLVVGALCVYALVRRNPNLLKGSKRIIFVKHKTLDALVLPPKVPVRNELVQEIAPEVSERKIFTVPIYACNPSKFNTHKSTRSGRSNAPSYISALQPTEDQLAEWRIKNHFDNDLTIRSADFFLYNEFIDSDITYESLK